MIHKVIVMLIKSESKSKRQKEDEKIRIIKKVLSKRENKNVIMDHELFNSDYKNSHYLLQFCNIFLADFFNMNLKLV